MGLLGCTTTQYKPQPFPEVNSGLLEPRPTLKLLPVVDAGSGQSSGLLLSQISAIIAENNSECALRGGIIALWQKWYLESKNASQSAHNTAPDITARNDDGNPK